MAKNRVGFGVTEIDKGEDEGKFEVVYITHDGFAHFNFERVAGPFVSEEIAGHALLEILMEGP